MPGPEHCECDAEKNTEQEDLYLEPILHYLLQMYAKCHGGIIEIGQTVVVADRYKIKHKLTRVRGGYLYQGQIYKTTF